MTSEKSAISLTVIPLWAICLCLPLLEELFVQIFGSSSVAFPSWCLVSLYVWNSFDSELLFDRCCSLKILVPYLRIVFPLGDFHLVLPTLGAKSHCWLGPILDWFWESQPESGHANFFPSSCLWSKVCSRKCSAYGSRLSPGTGHTCTFPICFPPLAITALISGHTGGHFLLHLLSVSPAIHLQSFVMEDIAVWSGGLFSVTGPLACRKQKPRGPSVCSLPFPSEIVSLTMCVCDVAFCTAEKCHLQLFTCKLKEKSNGQSFSHT